MAFASIDVYDAWARGELDDGILGELSGGALRQWVGYAVGIGDRAEEWERLENEARMRGDL